METMIIQIEMKNGRTFKIFCANRSQKNRVINSYRKLGDAIKLITPIQNGIHTTTQWEEIVENLLIPETNN